MYNYKYYVILPKIETFQYASIICLELYSKNNRILKLYPYRIGIHVCDKLFDNKKYHMYVSNTWGYMYIQISINGRKTFVGSYSTKEWDEFIKIS